MKKNIALVIAVAVLGAGAYFSERQFLSYSHPSTPATPVAAQGDTLQSQGVTLAAQNAASTKTTGIDFTLSVDGKNYDGTVPSNATVIDAMRMLTVSDNFQFTSKDFPGMGAFIESINGKINADGFYWILYINGKSSDTGASQTTILSSDKIEWRYEKGY